MNNLTVFIVCFLAVLAVDCIKLYFRAFLEEKGKNAATKQDIAKITEQISSIEHGYDVLLEAFRAKEQLRIAALDRRLEVHQEAFVLWWDLMRKLHTEVDAHVMKCQEFWVQKNLYLTADASYAFRQAYDAALNHKMLKDIARDRKSNEANTDVSSNFSQILSAGNVIRNAVELPPLKDKDLPTPET
jgi:hypothetical protein